MQISSMLSYAGGFQESAKEIERLEQAGLDLVWVAEAWGFDAPSLMGYLAARTKRVKIASGILPIYSRTPALLAMTAAGVDALSGGRAMLGLGASGPQVIEGWHGVEYDAPVSRLREIIEICRKVWRRERLVHEGKKYPVPLPPGRGTGLGKPLTMITRPVRDDIPIAVASLGPKSVEMTAELADAWLPVFWLASKAHQRWGPALEAGLSKRDPGRGPLDVFVGGAVAIGEGLEHLRNGGRPMAALYIGGMGAKGKNFYNDVFASYGYEREAALIQDLFLSGKKKEAEAAIPQSYIDATTLIGPRGFVADRVAELRESGVTSLNVALLGDTLDDKVRNLEALRDIVDSA